MVDRRLLTLDDVARALGYITDVDNRTTWLQMGMAIKAEFGPAGFDVWDNWSRTGDSYKPRDALAVWKSFKKAGVGIGTLIKNAKDNGFEFSASALSDDEVKRRAEAAEQRKIENQKRRAAEREAEKQSNERAARVAAETWPKLPRDGHSPYLQRKGIYHFDARFGKNHSIAIPLIKNEQLTGLQWIQADGSKKFLTGTEKSGASYVIRPDSTGPRILCTGYATGCSIAMAVANACVEVCFDDGNLVTVARERVKTHPGLIIAADNDHGKPSNSGLEHAKRIVDECQVRAVWPEGITGSDFNDLHVEKGATAVEAAFKRAEPQVFPAISGKSNNSPSNEPAPDPNWREKLARGKGKDDKPGPILGWASNISLIFENDEQWRRGLSYCDFSYRIIKRRDLLDHVDAGEWSDSDTSAAMIWMARAYGFEPGDQKLAHALVSEAKKNRFHPVREYLDGLTWDKTPRLDHWLSDVYESPASAEYLSAVGSKFLIGAVARIYRPGCKMDNVMILEGAQGLRKSTSVHKLFGDWFSDAPIPLGDKDSYQNIQGVWCHELAELDSFNKAESTTAKNFFTQTRDRYRPSYGHRAEDFPRQTVFVGTTNQDEYLKDYTGNRRYWPVRCAVVNLDVLDAMRDQLWAEAVVRYKKHEPWWVKSDAERQLFEAEQDGRLQIDPWQYPIEDYLHGVTLEHVTSADILTNAIEKDPAHVTRADQNRISPIMKALGWAHKKKRVSVRGKSVPRWVYERPGGENA